MKVIVNKQTDIKAVIDQGGEPILLTYSDLIKLVCNTMIQGGYSISDIKSRIAITSACDGVKPGKEIKLESSDATYLQSAIKNQKWFMSHKDILGFVDDVEKMKETPAK